MFGVALGINTSDFVELRKNPRAVFGGVLSQFAFLPVLTFILVILSKPHPALALGMILVAACPGGNISNFFSSISGANVSLSVTLTAIATLLSPLMTPLNFEFWSSQWSETEVLLRSFRLNFFDMLNTVLILLVFPLILGIAFKKRFQKLTSKIEKPIRILSILILFGFIGVALSNNWEVFKNHLGLVFLLVLVHNLIALSVGYFTGMGFRLNDHLRRTLSIETGIQNSGLGLIIIFNFFDGNGGMAMITAWWGVWHILAGFAASYFFRFRDKRVSQHNPS